MSSERKYPPHEAQAKLESFCAYQERSRKEILMKLSSWGYDGEPALEIVEELISRGFLDDARFADSFVSGKFRFKKWGRVKLKYELRLKGISEDLISRSLSTIDQDKYFEQLKDLTIKKWQETKGPDLWTRKAKLMRFLSSKGYESDLISDVVEELLNCE